MLSAVKFAVIKEIGRNLEKIKPNPKSKILASKIE
jgi:hypothetical protein